MEPTLLVLAAGMGSRFGGLKQIEEVGPNGELILDYSVYDAMQAGFGRVVFVIRRDIEEAFKSTIGQRFESKLDVDYAYQEMDDVPAGYQVPANRSKPWGTGHAVLAARNVVDTPFAVINADDFYGRESYQQLVTFLASETGADTSRSAYALAGFPLRNTLSEHGHVSRGVCTCDENGMLTGIEECTHIEKDGEGALQRNPDGSTRCLDGNELVSMNMWAFGPELFQQLDTHFRTFLADHGNSEKSEFYLPAAIDALLQVDLATCRVLATSSHWAGMTYREDIETLKQFLSNAHAKGQYPQKLWHS